MEVKKHNKEWFHEVWRKHGWEGEGVVMRIEFRYARECLREMGIEDPYQLLNEIPQLWAYSSQKWLRHTCPDGDQNQSRWATSEVWEVVQAASDEPEATPAVRTKKIDLDTERAKAGFVGYATSWAARAVGLHTLAGEAEQRGIRVLGETQGLPLSAVEEDGGGFLEWAYEAMQGYLTERKAATFVAVLRDKALKLGLPVAA